MSIETKIKAQLDDHTGLAALVSDRNYPAKLPQNPTYPNTVYTRTGTNALGDFDGNVKENPTIQIDCRDLTYAGARALAAQVKAAMKAATTYKSLLQFDNDFPYEQQVATYRVVLRFSVWDK